MPRSSREKDRRRILDILGNYQDWLSTTKVVEQLNLGRDSSTSLYVVSDIYGVLRQLFLDEAIERAGIRERRPVYINGIVKYRSYTTNVWKKKQKVPQ